MKSHRMAFLRFGSLAAIRYWLATQPTAVVDELRKVIAEAEIDMKAGRTN